MGATPNLITTWRPDGVTIDDSFSTRPRRVFQAGSSASRVHQASACSTDNAAIAGRLLYLKQMTDESDMGTGALVDGGGGSDTITRTTGSFVTDGWQVGDILFVHGPTTRTNGFLIELTAVAATTLTFATSTVNTAEDLPAGAALYRALRLGYYDIPANAGNASGVPAIDLLDDAVNPMFDASPDRYIEVGANDALGFMLGTAVGSGEQVDVYIGAGDY